MKLLAAFHHLLTSDDELDDEIRQQGKDTIRSLIDRVYHERRPRSSKPVAISLSRNGGIPVHGVKGPAEIEQPIVGVNVWGQDTDELKASEAVEEVLEALKDFLPQYNGPMGDRLVRTISPETEPISREIQPVEGQDNWTYHSLVTYMLGVTREMAGGPR